MLDLICALDGIALINADLVSPDVVDAAFSIYGLWITDCIFKALKGVELCRSYKRYQCSYGHQLRRIEQNTGRVPLFLRELCLLF
jgi:hypothetical protein